MPDVYLVKRGPRPEHHRAPWHPVVICAKRRIAKEEAGWSGAAAWVWSHDRSAVIGGWLLERWNGLDIDYGHVVRGFVLPDGTDTAFVHQPTGREPWPLLAGAVWWDDKPMPRWLTAAGAVYPPDRFSQQHVLDRIADDGASGFGRQAPAHWTAPAPLQRWEIADGPRIPNGATVTVRCGIGGDTTFVWGTVLGLTATLELPNVRWLDEYRLRLADGTETTRYRPYLEQENAPLVREAAC